MRGGRLAGAALAAALGLVMPDAARAQIELAVYVDHQPERLVLLRSEQPADPRDIAAAEAYLDALIGGDQPENDAAIIDVNASEVAGITSVFFERRSIAEVRSLLAGCFRIAAVGSGRHQDLPEHRFVSAALDCTAAAQPLRRFYASVRLGDHRVHSVYLHHDFLMRVLSAPPVPNR